MLKTTDNQTLISGINTVGMVSLLAYTLRTFNEVNSNIEDLRSDLENFKRNYSENNKRSNMAFNHLNTKLEENSRLITSRMERKPRQVERKPKVVYEKEPEEEMEEEMEEITTFSTNVNDEISGALSELLGS